MVVVSVEKDSCIVIDYSFPYKQSKLGGMGVISLFRVMYFLYNIGVYNCYVSVSVTQCRNVVKGASDGIKWWWYVFMSSDKGNRNG